MYYLPRIVQLKHQQGFTLIEMLVAVSIGLLLIGIGVANYVSFNERQKVLNTAKEIETIVQTGLSKARGGDLGGCDELVGYRLTFVTTADPVTALLVSECQDGSTGLAKNYSLGHGVAVGFVPGVTEMRFPVLVDSITFTPSTTSVSVQLTSEPIDSTYAFSIATGGDVNEGVWQ